jgi:hypothetical protein
MKSTKIYTSILAAALLLGSILFFSCKKNPSEPPVRTVAMGPSVTIQQLRNNYATYNGVSIKFSSNTILNGVVTCDEASGNLYKQVYIRDYSGTFAVTKNYGAIALRFLHGTSGFLSVGDSIAVNLNGALLDKSSGGSLQIDSLDAINQVVHLKSGLNPQPLVVTIPQLNTFSNTIGGGFIYDGQLVQLNNVEFVSSEVGTTFAIYQAPPVIAAPKNVNKFLGDSLRNTIVAYNSGYANFATQIIPNNSGSVVAVANLYSTMQLTLRSFAEINLNKPYNTIVYDSISQNFSNAGLSSKSPVLPNGWTSIAYKGNLTWQGAQYGNPFSLYNNPLNWKYAPSASNYHTTDVQNDMWLISPPVKDHGAAGNYLDFSMVEQYGTNIKLVTVLVSGTFDGTHLDPTQWQDISFAFPNIPPSASNGWTNGTVSFKYTHPGFSLFTPNPVHIAVPPNTTGTFYIAFRYQSSTNINYPDSTGATYLLGTLVLK